MENKELELVKKQSDEIVNKVMDFKIKSQDDLTLALDYNADLFSWSKKIKTMKESATKPIKESLKQINSWFEPLEDRLSKVMLDLKIEIKVYKEKIEEQNIKKEEKIMEDMDSGKISMAKASDKLVLLEQKVDIIPTMKVKKLVIDDEKLIPKKYWVIDMVLLRKDVVTNGMDVPGARMVVEETILSK